MAIRKPLELCGDLTSLIIYGRRPSVLSEIWSSIQKENGGPFVYTTIKKYQKLPWTDHHRIINGKSLIMTPRYILIPDPHTVL